MSLHRSVFVLLAGMIVACLTPAALAQRFEFGGGGGASVYTGRTVTGPAGSVDAGFNSGYGFSGYLGQLGNRLGGELRYSFANNEMRLASAGRSFSMTGLSQSIHYDLVVYLNANKAKIRPYILAGGGMKQYTGAGSTSARQPFMSTVVLTDTSEWKPLVTGGGGIRFVLNPKLHLRAEVLTYMTQAPTKVITPVGGQLSGWYFQIMPTINLSYVW